MQPDAHSLHDRLRLPRSRPLRLGWDAGSRPPKEALEDRSAQVFAFVVLDFFSGERPAFSDRALRTGAFAHRVVARVPMRAADEVAERLAWARHAGAAVALLDGPRPDAADLACAIAGTLSAEPGLPVNVQLAAPDPEAWTWWRQLSAALDEHPRLEVCLSFAHDVVPSEALIRRWTGEPVSSVHLQNAPSEALRSALHEVFRGSACRAVVTGTPAAALELGRAVDDIFEEVWGEIDDRERFAADHRDTLTDPVEPHADELPAAVYEFFEGARTKYGAYENAILQDLRDLPPRDAPLRIAVLGAGRGPLVDRVRAAAQTAGRAVRITAVEQNPHAFTTLQFRRAQDWSGEVRLERADMRQWRPQQPLDLAVSELIGSFGDSELAPECLEHLGAMLAPDGRSIPRSMTSYLAPVSAPRLFGQAIRRQGLERPWVVYPAAVRPLAPEQPCLTFQHPDAGPFDRSARIRFDIEDDGALHGFVGTFTSELSPGVSISTGGTPGIPVIDTWGQQFFPFKNPVNVEKGQTLEVALWRRSDRRRVWYTWALVDSGPMTLHNAHGHAHAMRL